MRRQCPACGAVLNPLASRCACGLELPESTDRRSDPDRPRCGVCGAPIPLQAEHCPACGAAGYPALRARRGRRSQGPPAA